jgi:hypothetical protein
MNEYPVCWLASPHYSPFFCVPLFLSHAACFFHPESGGSTSSVRARSSTPFFSASLCFFLMLLAFSTRRVEAAHRRYVPALAHCVKCLTNGMSTVLKVCLLLELYQLCYCRLQRRFAVGLCGFSAGGAT